ncbi:MAG: ECF transporter S component [Angelakisella sp.]
MSNTNLKLGRLAKLGLLAALSIVLVFFIHFPIFPTAKFLEYDPADIPIMIATFAFGPWYGLMTTIVVAVVQGLPSAPPAASMASSCTSSPPAPSCWSRASSIKSIRPKRAH